MHSKIDTREFGLLLSADKPRTKQNPHRSKWRIKFDTGIDMLVPEALFLIMQFHLQERDPKPPRSK